MSIGGEFLTQALYVGERSLAEFDYRNASPREVTGVVLQAIAAQLGGQSMYFPKNFRGFISDRDQRIRAEFTGRNLAELAKRHRLSVRRVREIVTGR